MNFSERYRFACTLSYGDIYGQVIIWLIVIFASLAAALALMSSPLYAFLTIGLILVLSLPFLLFAFVTTLLNHIEFALVTSEQEDTVSDASLQNRPQVEAVGG